MKKCDVSKCRAQCCYNVPLTKFTLNTNKKRVAVSIIRLKDTGLKDEDGRQLFLPVTDEKTENNRCPFLNERYRCNIYDNRPRVCRKFGDGGSVFLRCEYLEDVDKDDLHRRTQFLLDSIRNI